MSRAFPRRNRIYYAAFLIFVLYFTTIGGICGSTTPTSSDPEDGEPCESIGLELERFNFPVGVTNTWFEQHLTPTGGNPPYTYQVNTLPWGLSYQGSATKLVISGTILQQGGNYPIIVTVGDQCDSTVVTQFDLVISVGAIPLAGTWDLTTTNVSLGTCPDVRNPDFTVTRQVTFVQGENHIAIHGFTDDPDLVLDGTIMRDHNSHLHYLKVIALYPAFGDTMSETFTMAIYSESNIYVDFLDGYGDWDWLGDDSSTCTGQLDVIARRVVD